MRGAWRVLLSLTLLAALGACATDEEDDEAGGQPIAVDVEAFDFYFDPTTVIAELGAEVTISLQNSGESVHSFTVPDLDFEMEAEGGESTESSFVAPEEPGSFDFFCKYHPSEMKGSVSIGGEPDEVPEGEEDQDDDDDDDDEDVDVDVEEEEDEDV